jgi:hypothetical protein
MYAMYYASMLRCWQLVRILVRTNHHCLRVGRHMDPLQFGLLLLRIGLWPVLHGGLFSLSHYEGSGEHGYRIDASFSCAWLPLTAAGWWVNYPVEILIIRFIARCASKKGKSSNTSWLGVYFLGKSGFGYYPWWGYKGVRWNRGKKISKTSGEQWS